MNPTTTAIGWIPLHRVDSSKYTASEYTTTSTVVDSTTSSLLSYTKPPNAIFTPTTTLQIQSPGKQPISLPLAPATLQIPIFSLLSGRPIYLSLRPKRSSGSCYLVSADDETSTSIASTTYVFGPGRNPTVKIGRDDEDDADVFEIVGKSLFSRATYFESRKWGRFEWRYARKVERQALAAATDDEEAYNLLVLEKIEVGAGGKEERIRVAQLVRGKETRTPGTKVCYAGNGGRLEMCLRRDGEKVLVDEVTVVVTCLVMLKKEIDRLRAIQTAVILH